ncbi:SWI SNF, matrix associated, actin dependent regulator of chromatin, sub d, member 3 [Thoreauomyces humboldtii]|nr:SWI SNF, matrix associated, actin dependent regulator of chromatin, sub d, member 3 [Thoreauomyces humboldtii]
MSGGAPLGNLPGRLVQQLPSFGTPVNQGQQHASPTFKQPYGAPTYTMQPQYARQPSIGSASGTPVGLSAKRPSEPTVAPPRAKKKRPAEKVLPKQIEACIPESKLYTELQEFEKKLDATISRKKLDMLEQKSQLKPTKRIMRVFLSNLSTDQYADMGGNEDAFSLEGLQVPSWTLRIEGRLLDFPNARKPQVNPPKFSTFVKSVVVELQRDQVLSGEENVVQWFKNRGGPSCDGFEIKRKGDNDVNVKILVHLESQPEKFKLSSELGKLLDIHTDTSANVIIAIWQYIKFQKLQDPDDKRHINCDEPLRKASAFRIIFGQNRVTFSEIGGLLQKHFSPQDPVCLTYTISTDKEYQYSQFAYDIEVDMPNAGREHLEQSTIVTSQMAREIGALDEQITTQIQTINQCKLKRDFMLAFAEDPIAFLDRWMVSQARDLETILGDTHVNTDETRRAQFFDQSIVHQAVFHHLRLNDALHKNSSRH